MHYLSTQRQGTWHHCFHVAVLTAQSSLSLPHHACEGVWTFSGAWYLSVSASLMIWKAILTKPSHCLRPEIWSNPVILLLLSQICCSLYKSWMFLENKNTLHPCSTKMHNLYCPWFKIRLLRQWRKEIYHELNYHLVFMPLDYCSKGCSWYLCGNL